MVKFISNTRLFFEGLVKILFLSRFRNLHKQIRNEGQDVLVLGNGPSLGELLGNERFLAKTKEMDCVAVNAFCDHEYFEIVRPKYYMMAAPEFWQDNINEFYYNFRTTIFSNLAKKVSWEFYLFIPWKARKKKFWQDIVGTNPNIRIIYYNITPIEGGNAFRHYCYRGKLGLPRIHNVIGPSIMNMIWLDYKRIYLVGVEHSWLPQIQVDENNIAYVGQPHFYDKDAKPDRMTGVGGQGYRKLHEILHKFYLAFRGYFEIQEFAIKNKVEIINLTEGSYIDAFPRQKIDIFIDKSE